MAESGGKGREEQQQRLRHGLGRTQEARYAGGREASSPFVTLGGEEDTALG